MPEILLYSAQNAKPVWKRKLRQAVRAFGIWYRNLIYSLIEIMILCAASTVIFITVVSFLKALWHLYLQTPVGRKFVSGGSVLANPTLAELLSKDLILFSVEVTATTLIASLIIAAISQVLAARRIFYEGRGLANRLMWILLFITVSAHILTVRSQVDFPTAMGLSILPSLCMFTTCLTICARLLPELTPIGILELTRRLMNFMSRSE
ncbi:MAG: hypothetical protein PVI71_06310 [Desulfobacterales bacterium]|jgi:hypothetical protein